MERKPMRARSGTSRCRFTALLLGVVGLFLSRGASAVEWTVDDTTVTLGGYAKLDTIYSRFSDGAVAQSTTRDFYVPGGTPVFPIGASPHSYLDFHAKETRVWLGTKTSIGDHKLGSWVEIDFISGQIPQVVLISATTSAVTGSKIATNAYNPALRRAYITFDSLLFGQDWSTFQNVAVLPDGLDFIGPTEGTIWVRQPLVRWTYRGLQLAIETPESFVYPFLGAAPAKTDDNLLPDFVARYDLKTPYGDFALAGLLREMRDLRTVGNADDTSIGWGGSLTGKVPVFGKDDIRFMFNGGRGLGRYLGLFTLGDAFVTASNELKSLWIADGFVAYRHVWTEQWRSSFYVSGISGFNLGGNLATTATRRTGSATVNLLFSPVPTLTLGGEFRIAEREDVAGDSGGLLRYQMSAKYYF